MDFIGSLFASFGALLLAYRIWPRGEPTSAPPQVGSAFQEWPLVSIIVPARNEEAVLGKLLQSLTEIDYPAFEIVVVDDCSEDRTAAIARSFAAVRLISCSERPRAWKGKQWACHQGVQAAKGEFLLFTDADTMHRKDGLKRALAAMLEQGADGASALPFHSCSRFWEKLCGPFHVLLLAGTAPYGTGRVGQVFAIGQFLLFKRQAYESIGGHERVKEVIAEDIALASLMLKSHKVWRTLYGKPYFEVRMYENLADFIQGWRRSFRAGIESSVPWAPLEIAAFFSALLAAGNPGSGWGRLIFGASWLVVIIAQRKIGRFSIWGIVCGPFALGLFCWVSLLAVYDRLLKRPTIWKNRSYSVS